MRASFRNNKEQASRFAWSEANDGARVRLFFHLGEWVVVSTRAKCRQLKEGF